MKLTDSIFANAKLTHFDVLWGIALLVAVWVFLGIQAFQPNSWLSGGAKWSSSFEATLRTTIFVVHTVTVVFVAGEAAEYKGMVGRYAQFTIGSGILATLGQTSLVSLAENAVAFQLSFVSLALQVYANALMLGFIIADLRYAIYKAPRSELEFSLMNGRR